MKKIVFAILFSTILFANESFVDGANYECVNSHSIIKGKKFNAKESDAKENPLTITVNGNKIFTSEKTVFDFLMQKNEMMSYSNEDFMMLLTKNLELGLVPKKSKGQVQYYFKCNIK